jgi:hypothetical protein
MANDLDEARTGVDLLTEDLTEVAGLCAEDFLNKRIFARFDLA